MGWANCFRCWRGEASAKNPPMAKKFTDLRAAMSPESQARSEAKAQALLTEHHGLTPAPGQRAMRWAIDASDNSPVRASTSVPSASKKKVVGKPRC